MVLCDSEQPRALVVGNAVLHPCRERRHERALNGIFHRFEMMKTNAAHQQRD
jgi:hypothetical protein